MKSIRTQLNLTQRELAELIGVSPSIICLYEKGLRNLPAHAALQLSQLQLLMQAAPDAFGTARQKLQPDSKTIARQQARQAKAEKRLKAHARKAAFEAVRIAHQLSKMEKRHQQLTQKLLVIQQLMQAARPGTRRMSFLENMETAVEEGLDQCCPVQQLEMKYQLLILKAQQQAAASIQIEIKQHVLGVKSS